MDGGCDASVGQDSCRHHHISFYGMFYGMSCVLDVTCVYSKALGNFHVHGWINEAHVDVKLMKTE